MTDPASSSLRVPAELEFAGQELNANAAKIVDHLEELIAKLAPLEEVWEGPAQSYFQGLKAEWNYAAEGLFGTNGVLGQVANAMNVTWNNYADGEWANVRTWSA